MALLPASGPGTLVKLSGAWMEQRQGLLWLGAFFGAKVLAGLALLKLSAQFLPVGGFALFSQFLASQCH